MAFVPPVVGADSVIPNGLAAPVTFKAYEQYLRVVKSGAGTSLGFGSFGSVTRPSLWFTLPGTRPGNLFVSGELHALVRVSITPSKHRHRDGVDGGPSLCTATDLALFQRHASALGPLAAGAAAKASRMLADFVENPLQSKASVGVAQSPDSLTNLLAADAAVISHGSFVQSGGIQRFPVDCAHPLLATDVVVPTHSFVLVSLSSIRGVADIVPGFAQALLPPLVFNGALHGTGIYDGGPVPWFVRASGLRF